MSIDGGINKEELINHVEDFKVWHINRPKPQAQPGGGVIDGGNYDNPNTIVIVMKLSQYEPQPLYIQIRNTDTKIIGTEVYTP